MKGILAAQEIHRLNGPEEAINQLKPQRDTIKGKTTHRSMRSSKMEKEQESLIEPKENKSRDLNLKSIKAVRIKPKDR